MAGLAALMLLAGASGAAAQDVRVDAPIPHVRGQSVSPSFEGWYRNPDGTRSLMFGYFNRNYDERLDIPVGPGNRFEPGPADRGQPTHFLPRRQTGVFAVVVPADFEGRLTWSLTAYGETIAIPGHVRPEWEIDALQEVTSGNTPPVVRFGSPDGEPGQGQYGVRSSARAVVSEPAPIAVWATDDAVRKARSAGRPTRFGLVWSKYRGAWGGGLRQHRAGGRQRREGGDDGDVRHAGPLRPARARVGRLGGTGCDHGRRLLLLLDQRLPDGRRRRIGNRNVRPDGASDGARERTGDGTE